MLKHVSCILCGASSTQLLFIKDGFKIVKCIKCKLVYVNPRLNPYDATNIYSERYFCSLSSSQDTGYENYMRDEENFIYQFKKRLKIIEGYKNRGKILDVGCAAGFFLSICDKSRWDRYGVEICESMADYCNRKKQLNVFKGELKAAKFSDEVFDVITMFDSVEHMQNPLANLGEARRILRRDGIIAITVPNIGSAFARLSGKNWIEIRPEEHLYYFTKDTLKRTLEQSGFQIIKSMTSGYRVNLGLIISRLGNYSLFVSKLLSSILGKTISTRLKLYLNLGDLFIIGRAF